MVSGIVAAVAALTFAAGASPSDALADASTFPERTVRLVVTVAAGASSDMLTRAIAAQLSEDWGQPVVVENVPGASGAIGLRQVATAEPDGYTIAANGTGLALSVALGQDLPYDTLNDFRGVTVAVDNPQILVVHPGLGVSNWDEYIALVRERNGDLLFGLPSLGGIAHLINILVDQQTGTQVNYIPYSGGAPATVDLLGGNVDAITITLAAVTEHVREGRLVPIAVSTAERSSALPEVPTFSELGLDIALGSWQGFIVPAGVPDDIVERLNQSFVAAIHNPAVTQFLEERGFEIVASSADYVDELVAREIELYSEIVRSAEITVSH